MTSISAHNVYHDLCPQFDADSNMVNNYIYFKCLELFVGVVPPTPNFRDFCIAVFEYKKKLYSELASLIRYVQQKLKGHHLSHDNKREVDIDNDFRFKLLKFKDKEHLSDGGIYQYYHIGISSHSSTFMSGNVFSLDFSHYHDHTNESTFYDEYVKNGLDNEFQRVINALDNFSTESYRESIHMFIRPDMAKLALPDSEIVHHLSFPYRRTDMSVLEVIDFLKNPDSEEQFMFIAALMGIRKSDIVTMLIGSTMPDIRPHVPGIEKYNIPLLPNDIFIDYSFLNKRITGNLNENSI